MCSITANPCSSTSVSVNPLIVDIVVERILFHIGEAEQEQLLNYRLVCHKWNDMIVRKVNKSGHSFRIPLRYGPQVPFSLFQSVARRSANQVLDTVAKTLRGTAAHLLFDTILIHPDFYLAAAEVLANWKRLLKIQGEFIRHLKLNIRGVESTNTKESLHLHHVTDCEELVSAESLGTTFSATPSLETLDFSIRFSNQGEKLLFPPSHIPQLLKLTNITIEEPRGFSYSHPFLNQIFSMAPNLSTLNFKPWSELSNFATALSGVGGPRLVTTLRLDDVHIPDYDYADTLLFTFFQLTTSEVNCVRGGDENEVNDWVTDLIKAHSSTLEKLTLGSRKNEERNEQGENIHIDFHPRHPVFKTLTTLEINLTQFAYDVRSYKDELPVLQSLTLVLGNDWNLHELDGLVGGNVGQCTTLQHLSIIPRPSNNYIKNRLIRFTRRIFPMAEYHFEDYES